MHECMLEKSEDICANICARLNARIGPLFAQSRWAMMLRRLQDKQQRIEGQSFSSKPKDMLCKELMQEIAELDCSAARKKRLRSDAWRRMGELYAGQSARQVDALRQEAERHKQTKEQEKRELLLDLHAQLVSHHRGPMLPEVRCPGVRNVVREQRLSEAEQQELDESRLQACDFDESAAFLAERLCAPRHACSFNLQIQMVNALFDLELLKNIFLI